MNQYLQKMNEWVYDIENNVTNFFIKYKYVLFVSFIIGILINSIDIVTFKFGIDSEVIPLDWQFKRQRFGSLFLYYIFPFLSKNIISQLVGIISLIFASLLIICKYNISNVAKTLFVIMIISCSYFSFLKYYFFQFAYNAIGLLLVVMAFKLIENGKNIFGYLLAVFLLFIGGSSYQSNFSIFLSVVGLSVMLNFISDKNVKKAIILIMKSILILLLSLLVYYIAIKINPMEVSSYFINMILWFNDDTNYFKIIQKLFKFIIYENVWFYIYSLIIVLYLIFNFKDNKERIFFILISIFFLICVYSLNIVLGNRMGERARTPLALFPAFIFLLIYMFQNNKILKMIAILLAFVAIIINTNESVKFQLSNKIAYEQDKITASKVLDIIYTKYPEIYTGEYKISFYGKLMPFHNYYKVNNDSSASFFAWDGGNPLRILSFLKILGLPESIQNNDVISFNRDLSKAPDDLKELIKKMPSYPNSDCAQLYKDTVVVKLSD